MSSRGATIRTGLAIPSSRRSATPRGFRVGPTQYDIGGAAFRITAFGDAAWAGPRDAFGTEGWQASVGAGFSVMEGVFRIDIARSVRGDNVWRLHIYTDALM